MPRIPYPVSRKIACAFGLAAVLGVVTPAVSAADLVNLSVEIDGWTMMPIAENGATTHIIAARNDDEGLSTDIDVVLYEKIVTGWSGSAYDPSMTKEDAMIDLANEFGLSDPFAGDWHIHLDTIDVIDHIVPRIPFGKGFFVTDPLYQIVTHIGNAEPIAESAEDNGLAAASSTINTGGASVGGVGSGPPVPTDCGCEVCLQDMIALGADVFLAGGDAPLDDADLAMEDFVFERLPCCKRRTVTTIDNIGSWVCGPWTATDGPSLVPGEQGLRYNCSYSNSPTRNRERTRIRRCSNCSRCTWRESCTETGTIVTHSDFDTPSDYVLPALCPPTPASGPGCTPDPSTVSGCDDDSSWTTTSQNPPCCP